MISLGESSVARLSSGALYFLQGKSYHFINTLLL